MIPDVSPNGKEKCLFVECILNLLIMGSRNNFLSRIKHIWYKIEIVEVIYILLIVLLGLFLIHIY